METREIPECIYCHARKATRELFLYRSIHIGTQTYTQFYECDDTEACIHDVREMMGSGREQF